MRLMHVAGWALAAALLAGVLVGAQAPAGGRGAGGGQGRGASGPYPPRPPVDQAILERGRTLYSVHCAFCHGTDARGGDGGGPNLLRSQVVLSDQKGELIGEVIRNGRPGTAMIPMSLTPAQIADIADYVHNFPVDGNERARNLPPTIVVGSVAAGQATFQARCASCHSPTGDLKGLASRVSDPRQLQDYWLVPTAGRGRGAGVGSQLRPVTAAVVLPSGERIEGRLLRIDDFTVTIVPADGMPRSFGRRDNVPEVVVTDPVKPHRDMLPTYTDEEIHNLTAYLVTLQ